MKEWEEHFKDLLEGMEVRLAMGNGRNERQVREEIMWENIERGRTDRGIERGNHCAGGKKGKRRSDGGV